MKFSPPLVRATLVRRHKRFLADVILATGEQVTAHTANTGSMTGCQEAGSIVWLSRSDNPKRKYALTWEIVEVQSPEGDTLVGINTMLSNKLVAEGIETGMVKELQGYDQIKTEVRYGQENSRIDILLSRKREYDGACALCYVEVKNVTLVEDGRAYFPDAVSKRGSKHLRELMEMVKQGHRAVIFYCVQRQDALVVMPADHIDSEYGSWLRRAINAGVEAIAYQALVTPQEITLKTKLPVVVNEAETE